MSKSPRSTKPRKTRPAAAAAAAAAAGDVPMLTPVGLWPETGQEVGEMVQLIRRSRRAEAVIAILSGLLANPALTQTIQHDAKIEGRHFNDQVVLVAIELATTLEQHLADGQRGGGA